MRSFRQLSMFIVALGLILSACGSPAKPATLKIAVLPIIDTLPMYVAQQEGLFAKHGVNVEFVPVASAPERDQLLAAGQADGTVNETIGRYALQQRHRANASLSVMPCAPPKMQVTFSLLLPPKVELPMPKD